MKIRCTPAAAASAHRFMHDQDALRAIGAAVAGLAEDPLPPGDSTAGATTSCELTATGFCM